MKTKIETLKTDLRGLHQIPCVQCAKDTPHKIVVSQENYVEYTEYDDCKMATVVLDVFIKAMQIVRCNICEITSFRELKMVRELDIENSNGNTSEPVTEILYRHDGVKMRQLDIENSRQYFD